MQGAEGGFTISVFFSVSPLTALYQAVR